MSQSQSNAGSSLVKLRRMFLYDVLLMDVVIDSVEFCNFVLIKVVFCTLGCLSKNWHAKYILAGRVGNA